MAWHNPNCKVRPTFSPAKQPTKPTNQPTNQTYQQFQWGDETTWKCQSSLHSLRTDPKVGTG